METIVVKIKGLRSAACVSSIEYKLQQLEYVEAVHVDFVTSEALIRSFRQLDIEQIQKVVEENGYSLEISERASNFRRERPKKDNTLLFSGVVFFLLVAIEISMYFLKYELSLDLVKVAAGAEMFLVIAALLLARKYIAFGIRQLSSDIPSMDSLLAVSSLLAIVYSGYQAIGVLQGYASEYDLYCAAVSGAIFFTLYGKGNAQKAEQIFTSSKPESFKLPKATLLVNDLEHVISGNHLISGDTIIVREGSVIPADGLVLDGYAEVDEAEVSGSSALTSKGKGKEVFAETIVKSGSLKIKVTATGKNVKAVQLWRLAKQYANEPKSMQRLRHTDKIAAIFLPLITSISVIAGLSWYFYTGDAHLGFKILISVMLGAYPCAMGYIHSSALLSITKLANTQGIIFKNPAVLEHLHKITMGIFSKQDASVANRMDLVQLTALGLYVENALPDFLPDGRVRAVVDLEPKEKAELIRSLRWGGERTLVYGNKISDMPLLASGDVGVAVQNSAAEQFAHISLPQDEPKLILTALEISKKLSKIYKRNSILSLTFNLLSLPLAIGVWYAFGGLLLEPLLLASVMLLGGVSVIVSSKFI